MADLKAIRTRIEQQINAKGFTLREISLKIGHKDSYIQQYIKYGFPKRLSEVDRKRLCHILEMEEKDLIDDELRQSAIHQQFIANLPENTPNLEDYIMVDIYAPRPNTDLSDSVIGRMALNFREFPHWGCTNPSNLKIIRIDNDYMTPTFPSGSLILYDSTISEFTGDGIYITTDDKLAQIKRIQKINSNNYILMNDNPMYQNITTSNLSTSLLGKAVCCITPHPI